MSQNVWNCPNLLKIVQSWLKFDFSLNSRRKAEPGKKVPGLRHPTDSYWLFDDWRIPCWRIQSFVQLAEERCKYLTVIWTFTNSWKCSLMILLTWIKCVSDLERVLKKLWKFEFLFSCLERGHSTTTWTRRGGGGLVKSPHLSTQGAGGSLECPRGPKLSYFRKHFISLCTVMGGKKEIKLH